MHKLRLEGEKVLLKLISYKDATKLNKYTNEPELNEYSGPYKAAESVRKAEEYIKECEEEFDLGTRYIFGIYTNRGLNFVGTIGCFNIEKESRKGEIGFWVAREYWGKGFVTEAISCIIKFLFEEKKFTQIYAYTQDENKVAISTLRKNGFKHEEGKWVIKSGAVNSGLE